MGGENCPCRLGVRTSEPHSEDSGSIPLKGASIQLHNKNNTYKKMKIAKKTQKLLNEQFYNELYAAHIYFAISAYFNNTPFRGMSKWMRLQSKEEMEHAAKIYDYLAERGAKFETDSVRKPEKSEFSSPLDAFKTAYAHEQLVSSQIEKIFETANAEKDWASADLAAWFIKEQIEEENSTRAFVDALEYAGSDKVLLMGVDKWAGSRSE